MSVLVAKGPAAVPGFICRSANSNVLSVSLRYCAAGGGIVVCPWALVAGGGCCLAGNRSSWHFLIRGGVRMAGGVFVVSRFTAAR